MRLVTVAPEPGTREIRGILEIDLQPGWKTYWRDPGDAGVPPSLEITEDTGIAGAHLSFPVPGRHEDASGSWAGYSASVSLPVVFSLSEPDRATLIEADVFLGLCRTVCVPVQARLRLDPAAGDENEDRAAVAMAFRRLPAAAGPEFGAAVQGLEDGVLTLDLALPPDARPRDIFLSGAETATAFGKPEFRHAAGRWTARVHSDAKALPPAVPYTLLTDRGAVSGVLGGK